MLKKDNPTITSKRIGNVAINRVEPGDQKVRLNYSLGLEYTSHVLVIKYRKYPDCGRYASQLHDKKENVIEITGLDNTSDYMCYLSVQDQYGEEVARSDYRIFRCGTVIGKPIAYMHPKDFGMMHSGRSTCSPDITRAPDGSLLVSHDLHWENAACNTTHVYRSKDNGETWQFSAEVRNCYWASLFTFREAVYLLGATSQLGGPLVVFRSTNNGNSWLGPTEITSFPEDMTHLPHKAPTPVFEYDGRLWCSVEMVSKDKKGMGVGVVSIKVNDDMMNSSKWVCSDFHEYDEKLVKDVVGTPSGAGILEGNLVIGPDKKMYNILRYHIENCEPNIGRVYATVVDTKNPKAAPTFAKTIAMPGNRSKFYILKDPDSEYYYVACNRVTTENINQRTILSLLRSTDLETWVLHRDIVNLEDNCYPDNSKEAAYQYPSFMFDGDDMLLVSRTAANGAYNFHNANYITLHRVINFRR